VLAATGVDLGLECSEVGHLVPLGVVPLRFAGDDRADHAARFVVLVLVGLRRLPAEEPLVGDP
jgi:hypothetical protein